MSSTNQVAEVADEPKTVIPYSPLPLIVKSDDKPPMQQMSWQTVQRLDKNFKFWPGFVYAGNFLAKVGVIAFMPNDMRPTLSLLVDNASDALYASPYRVGHLVENVFEELKIELPKKKKRTREKFAESKSFCAPCIVDTFVPQRSAYTFTV